MLFFFFFFFFSLASFLYFAHLLFKFLPFPSWAAEMRLLLVLFLQELLFYSFQCLKTSIQSLTASILRISSKMSSEGNHDPKLEIVESVETMSVLDLPELVLESILGRLPPASLCSMSDVCSSMKDRCRSDHLWEKHMKEKWGRIIGTAACREWQLYVSSRKDYLQRDSSERNAKRWIGALASVWPISLIVPKHDNGSNSRNSLPVDSIMAWYLALESGRFWFPAQVYNRESEHVGFMLSCYDAELSYDCSTDTFYARYPPHGRRTVVIENHVQWDRIRAPAIDTPADTLHVSDCVSDLQPGDHFEIQWRRNKEFPYGWWYGVVGHLESCDGNELHCRCDSNETVVLEFNQYALGSRWRRTLINRKDHREEGNEMVGFYGGIRKLQDKQEISKWRRLWPTETLI